MAIRFTDAMADDVVALTQRLVRVNTVNPPGNEEAAMRVVGAYLEAAGIQPEYQELEPGRANLIARLPGSAGSGHLVLSGHMDVVHQGQGVWDHEPFDADLVDGRLVGRGTADMKGGVAAMAVALAGLSREGFRGSGDLILAVSAGEEVDTAGARLMARTNALADAAYLVVGEPTGLDVFIAERGVLWLRVSAHGRTAHGSMPHLGVNAISYIARVIPRLEANPFAFEAHPILGEPTVSVNGISGGVKVNVIPDYCEIAVDMRTVPGQSHDALIGDVRRLLDDAADEMGNAVRTNVEVLQNMPPVETSPEDRLVRVIVDAGAAARGASPTIGGVSYGTDGAVLAPALNCPLVIFGPGQPGQAHQPNEFIDVSELHQAVRAYSTLARTLLST
jgi:succinyl-diaminopimelate desuccinylase